MAFLNVILPDIKLIHDVKKSSQLPVTILSNGTFEYRVKKVRFDRFTYSIPSHAVLNSDKLSLYQFYSTVNGSLYSFLFKDVDNKWNGQRLTYAGSSKWYFTYPGNLLHPLWHYDAYMTVLKNGSSASYTHGIVDNMAYLTISGSGSGDVITISSGTIYLCGRFESGVTWSLSGLDENNLPYIVTFDELVIQEVYER